jgi:SPP1 gp7 family putative phage head morphogenesis protein
MDAILSQANERAIAWAENRAAELVTQIDETTRDGIRDLTVRSLEEGWSTQEISDRLDAAWEFGGERSDMIARTEVAFADIQGNLAGYRESGVVEGREWVIAQDEYCEDCESMSGMVVPIGGDFPGGDPPLHPNCRCDILPIITSTGD